MKILVFVLLIVFAITALSEFYLKWRGFGDPIRYDSNIFMDIHQKLIKKK